MIAIFIRTPSHLVEQVAKLLSNGCKGELHVSLTVRPTKVGAQHNRPQINIKIILMIHNFDVFYEACKAKGKDKF